MPHKANPVRATLIAAAARQAPSLAATLYGSLRRRGRTARPAPGTPSGSRCATCCGWSGGAARDAAELAEGLRVHADAHARHLDLTHGLIVSERLAAELAPVLGRARAKELLTAAAAERGSDAERPGRSATSLTIEPTPELRDLAAHGATGRAHRPHPLHRAPPPSPHATRCGAPRTRDTQLTAPEPPCSTTALEGPASAPPLLLGPSLGTSLAVWDPQLPALPAPTG